MFRSVPASHSPGVTFPGRHIPGASQSPGVTFPGRHIPRASHSLKCPDCRHHELSSTGNGSTEGHLTAPILRGFCMIGNLYVKNEFIRFTHRYIHKFYLLSCGGKLILLPPKQGEARGRGPKASRNQWLWRDLHPCEPGSG